MRRRNFLVTATATSVIAAAAIDRFSPPGFTQNPKSRTSKATPFKVKVPQATLDRIRQRVLEYEWYTAPARGGWEYGADLNYLKELCQYWVNSYNWRAAETAMNQFSHYKAPVERQQIHFVYEAGSGSNPQPVLLLHGWPYSFHSLLHLVKPLAHPEHFGGNAEDGLDVIVPSLPGFAFSDPPAHPSSLRSIARRLHRLMTDVLGYGRYLIQGGDFGAVAGEWLAMDFPAAVKGLHENLVAFRHAGSEYGSGQTGPGPATAEERAFVQREKENFMRESAYFLLQSTRPETLSVAMMDSPVGTAAWIIEKFYKWSDQRDRSFEQIFTKDQLLTNVMIYLVTRSFHTSIWPYAAFKDDPFSVPPGQKIAVPVAVATFPDPLNPAPPRSFAARSRSNIVQWTAFSRGGHFPFLEQPEPFLKDLQKFARLVR